jgi:dihydroorotate dehydrogenase
MSTYKKIILPILDKLDSESLHSLVLELFHLAEFSSATLWLLKQFAYKRKRFSDRRLRVVLGSVEFDNPLIVGAGWDKFGRAVKSLWQLGFAGVEVGTVVANPQPGNPKPRQFVLSSGVILNWLGFNSPGMEAVARNLERYRGSGIPIGISVGKNRDVEAKDAPLAYATVVRRLYDFASYFAINVSSPNTPGLRGLQDKKPLGEILHMVNKTMDEVGGRKPVFVKISPDLSFGAVEDVVEVAIDNSLTGIIATNTTENPYIKAKYGDRWRNVQGGLSGDDEDFRRMATEKIAYIYRRAGSLLKIIGVGGIKDAETALEKIKAGASALQVVTAIRSEGLSVAGKINSGILEYMEREGIDSIEEIVGVDSGKYGQKEHYVL